MQTEARPHILIVEDTSALSMTYALQLEAAGLDAECVDSVAGANAAVDAIAPDVVLLDLGLPDGSGLEVLDHVSKRLPRTAVIVVTADESADTARAAMRRGAWDFLVKPVSSARLITTVQNALERGQIRGELEQLRSTRSRDSFHGFVGASAPMQALYQSIENVAQSNAAVFVTGESGTGKELCAEAIHRTGPRAEGPFVAVNCGAIPSDLMESELFGHLKGAFTGATAARDGAALVADGGTLFLDEIGEMELGLQTKLLRFLQTATVQRVGSSKPVPVDVRIICATNRRPLEEVRRGRFREDLYYRLNVIPIHLPPLRDRGADVALLAQRFLTRFAQEEGKQFEDFAEDCLQYIQRYPWPGNVRELQNVIRRISVMHGGTRVASEMLPENVRNPDAISSLDAYGDETLAAPEGAQPPTAAPDDLLVTLDQPLHDIERSVIEAVLHRYGGSVPATARALEIAPSTLYRKMERWKKSG